MSFTSKHDDTLFAILSDCKTLPAFFDQIFGFLKRRTDFYHVCEDKASEVGLPPGFAENIVRHSFFKWQADEQLPQDVNESQKDGKNVKLASQQPQQNETFTSADSYNGAVYDKYSWSQSITDLDIIIKIPTNITTRDLSVNIQTNRISVKLKNDSDVFLEGEFSNKIKHTEALWSLDKNKLVIHLEKCSEVWWDRLVTTENKLDISKIDCSRPFEELSEEAQAKIEELTWNQERKRLGLPTSDKIQLENTLKKAWNAEGSPFSGPYDPSQVIMN